MSAKCTIDIYSGEAYDKARHIARELFWSDDSFRYWGLLYDAAGKIVGDYTAKTAEDAEAALGVRFTYN